MSYCSGNRSRILLLLMIAASPACTLSPQRWVSTRIDLSAYSSGSADLARGLSGAGESWIAPPSSFSAFDCYGINVTGVGIPYVDWSKTQAASTESPGSTNNYGYSSGCTTYPALTSDALAPSTSQVSISVPAGPARTFTVIGLKMPNLETCPVGQAISSLANLYTDTQIPYFYALGAATSDLFTDSAIDIVDTYDPTQPANPLSCSGSGSRTFVHVIGGNAVTGFIQTYQFNSSTGSFGLTGNLTGRPELTAPAGATADTSGHFIYVAPSNTSNILAYSLDPAAGQLTQIGAYPTAAGKHILSVAVHPNADIVYAGVSENSYYWYQLNPSNGTLTQAHVTDFVNGSLAATATTAGKIAVSSGTLFTSTSKAGTPTLDSFPISSLSTGALGAASTLNPTPGVEDTNQQILVSPSGSVLFAVFGSAINKIKSFTINASNGALTQANSISTGNSPVEAAMDSKGQYLYVANSADSTISAYQISSGGVMTPISTLTTDSGPAHVAVSPDGHFLLTVNNSAPYFLRSYALSQGVPATTPSGSVSLGNISGALVAAYAYP